MTNPNYIGQQAIHIAAYFGNIARMNQALEDGDSINAAVAQLSSHTPILFALYGASSLEAVQFMVENNADLNVVDSINRTPLHLAACAGKTEIIEYLLSQISDKKTAVLSLDNNFRTPLHALCMPGSETKPSENVMIASARQLLEQLPVEERLDYLKMIDIEGNTPAMLAKKFGYEHLLTLFASYGYDMEDVEQVAPADDETIDYYGRSRLHIAAFCNQADEVQAMLERGINPYIQNPQAANRTPFLYSCAGISDAEVALHFIHNCDLDVLSAVDDFGGTALHHAAYGNADILALLLMTNKTSDYFAGVVNLPDANGLTPLHAALMKGYNANTKSDRIKAVLTLLENGADAELLDNNGRNAEDIAELYDTKEIFAHAERIYDARLEAQIYICEGVAQNTPPAFALATERVNQSLEHESSDAAELTVKPAAP